MYELVSILILNILVLTKSETPCGDSMECIEKQLITYADDLDKAKNNDSILSVLSTPTRQSKSLDAEEDIIERCIRFLGEHELRIRIPTSDARNLIGEARTRKLRRIILPILLLLKLKAAVIFPLLLSAVALVAFKSLGVGVAALAIAGATALKGLLESRPYPPVSYEIVPQGLPQWSRSSSDGDLVGSPLGLGYHTIA